MIYFIVGIIYALINVTFRRLDGREDPLLVLFWIFIWPLAFIILLIMYGVKKYERKSL